ncbi:MAG: AAA family ATPase [Acidobacteria bacterium]|nr:AAA family ATPase [Acidobacteriota bacterium]MYA46476.1 AAA family ATPase [Acidobacteriota bacterium]MYI38285.1 AAA family ATPase [Acidobacteriota bacterium]
MTAIASPEHRTNGGSAQGSATEPPHRCALGAAAPSVVAGVPRSDRAAVGPVGALRLPNVGELAQDVVSGLGARWLDALVRIDDQTAGDVSAANRPRMSTGRRIDSLGERTRACKRTSKYGMLGILTFGPRHIRPAFERVGLASWLFAVTRPRDAKAATLGRTTLGLTMSSGTQEILMRDIHTVSLERQWAWGGVRIRTARGDTVVSGLPHRAAASLAAAVEETRMAWWRKFLGEHADTLRNLDPRVADLEAPRHYVRRRVFSSLVEEMQRAAAEVPQWWPDELDTEPSVQLVKRIRSFLSDPEAARRRANQTFLAGELERSRSFLDRVETRPLTEEQRRAVCVDDDRNLVVAGAGSGKTSVMLAKAGWIVERGDRRPKDLLLLAFARNARDELAQRIEQRLGARAAAAMNVQTFHSLGLSIIGEADGRRPAVAKAAMDDRALLNLLESIITELQVHPHHGRALIRWLAYGATPYRSEHEFRSQGDYWDYVRNHEIRSLQGELVKSFEECIIANFLYLNGVRYEYERPYEHDTATAQKGQYRPDFYLTDAGIYIEHFALDEKGNTPAFIDQAEYKRSRRWKLKLHAKHGTTLIQTFSHEQRTGRLTECLAERLRARDVALKPIPRGEVFAVLDKQKRVAPFTGLVATFLQHFKGARLSMEAVEARASEKRDGGRSEAFLRVFRPIFERYEAQLSEAGEIDFHDMINRATDLVSEGRYRRSFGYILVDEFQDISPGRAALLKALLGQSPASQLFAVGDDWQAIFRFAGSDIAIMRGFEEHFGAVARTDLETTFRCSDGLCDVATRFVLRNPAQIKKNVHPIRRLDGPGVWIGGDGVGLPLHEALNRIATEAARTEGRPRVLLLGRYRRLRPDMGPLRREHPDLNLHYETVHGAKGLEADYVVVIGICAGRYGFPSEITDDPLLDLVLGTAEEHPHAEERRLFYVALTRSRQRTYLLEDKGPRSAFVEELLLKGGRIDTFGLRNADDPHCPECRKGHLVQRTGKGSRGFYGCSNYPYCRHTQPPCPKCQQGLVVRDGDTVRCRECGHQFAGCPRCDGWLRRRKGSHGPFLGCSNWPTCDFTRTIRRRSSVGFSRSPRVGSKPSRRDRSRRRRGLGATPNPATKSAGKSGLRGRFSGGKGGVAPSPALRPEAESGSRRQAAETQRGQRVATTARTGSRAGKYATKGGLSVCPPDSAP